MDEKETIRIAGVVRESIVDGPGIRFVVFAQGCPHGCYNCHNQATHDFMGGYDCQQEKILAAVAENPLLSGVTFSGGEPTCQPKAFAKLAESIKEQNPELDIILYSGYTFEELMVMAKSDLSMDKLLAMTDILVDGKYEDDLRDLSLLYRGSSNQRIIDMGLSREKGEPVIIEKY